MTGLFIGHITVGGGHLQTPPYEGESRSSSAIITLGFLLLVRDLIARLRARRALIHQEEER